MMKKLRCAIYTRKSSEDGLEQEFNSLDAQREACAAYISSQKHEGWVLLPTHYDDGGLSGGSLERPALQQLLQDIADGQVDQIVVYKIDRLTRSLADFSKIVDTLDAAEASFVSVTQSFDTATSMGRLTLNLLTNPIYAGRIRHKDKVHEGQHEAIIDPERWDRIQRTLQDGAMKGRARKTAKQRSLLCGKIFDETGDRLTPPHSKTKAGTRLRYYVSHRLIKNSGEANKDGWRLPAAELEQKAAHVVRQHINRALFIGQIAPNASAKAITTTKAKVHVLCERKDVKPSLDLMERIELGPGQLSITIDPEKLAALVPQDPHDDPQDHLTITAPFQLRKRGDETKLIFADAQQERDEVLIKNIAKAHQWYQQIKAGKTLSEIADAADTSNHRVQQMIELAFLAPNIVKDVLAGQQPSGFTSNWFRSHGLPINWQDQRDLLATL